MRALGIDYGRKRIGLALSDATGLLARPWKTIEAPPGLDRVIAQILQELEALRDGGEPVDVIVLGWPRRLSGDANEQTPIVESLAARLQEKTGVPVMLQDERLSSREAESQIARREKDWRKRKARIDAAAAAVILQDYLDGRPRTDAAGELPESD